jgi:hypothetical protein
MGFNRVKNIFIELPRGVVIPPIKASNNLESAHHRVSLANAPVNAAGLLELAVTEAEQRGNQGPQFASPLELRCCLTLNRKQALDMYALGHE